MKTFKKYILPAAVSIIFVFSSGLRIDKKIGNQRFEKYMSRYGISPEEIETVTAGQYYMFSPWHFDVIYKDRPEYTYRYDYYMAGYGIFDKDILPRQVTVYKNGETILGDEYSTLTHPTACQSTK